MTGLAPMQLFRDIPVVPVVSVRRLKGRGGPIWPNFDAQVAARHCRGGIASDLEPIRPRKLRPLDQPVVWGGFLAPQFGHLVSEHLTRLPQSLRDRPDDLYLFTIMPGASPDELPPYISDVMDWYGLRRDRRHLVQEGYLASELRVAAQGDMLGPITTSSEFLDILEAISVRNGLKPEPNRFVFVTRAGMAAEGKGGHAGESYLAEVLHALGVTVVEPGQMSVRRQMELYAGAETLIFAEGSALHGRCLLGRVQQDIHVLRRRPKRNTAQSQLSVRCRRLDYHSVGMARLGTRTELRGNRDDLELAFYDPAWLASVFAGIGIDLAGHWDSDAYLASVRSDLAGWLATVPVSDDQMAENLEVLAQLDLLPQPLPTPVAPPHSPLRPT